MSAVKLDGLLSIPASGIAFASGSSLIGTALGGPVGGIIFAIGGAAVGIWTELDSQRRHEQQPEQLSADHKHE